MSQVPAFERIRRLVVLLTVLSCASTLSCTGLADRIEQAQTQREKRLLGKPAVRDEDHALRAVTKVVATSRRGAQDTGSGLFLGQRGGIAYIVTAFHVAARAGTDGHIGVTFEGFSGRAQKATYVAGDEGLDLAVIRVDYPPPEMTDKIIPFRTGTANDVGVLGQGKLGIALSREITAELVKKYALGNNLGALITGAPPGSPGAAAGLRPGDLITAFNGTAVRGAQDLIAQVKPLAGGSPVRFDVIRKGTRLKLSGRIGRIEGNARPVFTIGHPPGREWNWQSGYVYTNTDRNFLAISPSLNKFGVSGGPLFDDRYNVIGIAVRQGDSKDTALRIERVLEKLALWQIPHHTLFAHDFCARFQQVLDQRDSDFAGLRRGAGRPALGSAYDRHVWDSPIDLSGRNKSTVVRMDDGDYEFRAEMRDRVGIAEGELVLREIATEVKKCLPDSYLEKNRWGFVVTFKKDFWDTPRDIEIYKLGSFVQLRIP